MPSAQGMKSYKKQFFCKIMQFFEKKWCMLVQLLTRLHVRLPQFLEHRKMIVFRLIFKKCFSYRNFFQNGIKVLLKAFFFFCQKAKISCSLDNTSFLKFQQHEVQTCLRNVWIDFRLPMSALAKMSWNDKFTAEVEFLVRHFMLPLLILTLKGLIKSFHTLLIGIWTTCW